LRKFREKKHMQRKDRRGERKAPAAVMVAVAALVAAGCAAGLRELDEGIASEQKGDWAVAEEKYEVARRAGNGEACRKLAELWLDHKTEELLAMKPKDEAWREAARAVANRLVELGQEAATCGFPVAGIEEGKVRLEREIAISRVEEERQRLEEQIAEAEARRQKPEEERQRMAAQIRELQAEIAECMWASQELGRFVEEGETIREMDRFVGILDTWLRAKLGEGPPSDADIDRLMLGNVPASLEASRYLDRRLAEARARLDRLQGPWSEVLGQLKVIDRELMALQLQLMEHTRQTAHVGEL
jgi:chromosome segregation ATPase